MMVFQISQSVENEYFSGQKAKNTLYRLINEEKSTLILYGDFVRWLKKYEMDHKRATAGWYIMPFKLLSV